MKARLELTFPTELKNEAIICTMCKKFDIVVNIVEASFSTDTGWAILILDGDEEDVNKALDYLSSKNIDIEDQEEVEQNDA